MRRAEACRRRVAKVGKTPFGAVSRPYYDAREEQACGRYKGCWSCEIRSLDMLLDAQSPPAASLTPMMAFWWGAGGSLAIEILSLYSEIRAADASGLL